MASDAELVQAATGGDRRAFGLIVERYQNLVCAVAYSRLGDLASSEDLAQETFVAAWKQLAELRDPALLRGWLCGIVRNLARSEQRRQSRGLVSTGGQEEAQEAADSQPTPIQRAIKREEAELLWNVLRDIPETYREPLILYYRQDHSISAVAQLLDLSEDAVKQRLSRGRKMLKEQVAAFVEEALTQTQPSRAFASLVLAALPAAPHAIGAAAASAKGAAAIKAAGAAGLSGAVLGPVIGLLGAFFGAKASLDATRSPRERVFVWKMIVLTALLVAALLAIQTAMIVFFAEVYATAVFQIALWGTYCVLLIWLILWGNRRQRRIQVEDGTAAPQVHPFVQSLNIPPRAMIWSLAGAMLGGVCWVLPLGLTAGDWLTPALVFAATFAAWGGLSLRIGRGLNAKQSVLAYQGALAVIGVCGSAAALTRWSAWRASSEMHIANFVPVGAIVGLILLLCGGLALAMEIQYRRLFGAVQRRK